MKIIPGRIPPDNVALAEALALGAGTDPQEQAAVAMLLAIPYGLFARDDMLNRAVLVQPGDRDDTPTIANVAWAALGRDVAAGRIPMSSGERAAVRVACLLAGPLGDALTCLDEPLRRAAAAAVAHAAGVPAAPATRTPEQAMLTGRLAQEGALLGSDRPEGDGSEPVPAGVDGHPAGNRRQQPAEPEPGLTAGYADAVIQALRAAGLAVAGHDVVAGEYADIHLAHRWCVEGLPWPQVTLRARPSDGGWHLLPTDGPQVGPAEYLGLAVGTWPAEVAARVAELLADDGQDTQPATGPLGDPDDLRDHAEEHAVSRDYAAEYESESEAAEEVEQRPWTRAELLRALADATALDGVPDVRDIHFHDTDDVTIALVDGPGPEGIRALVDALRISPDSVSWRGQPHPLTGVAPTEWLTRAGVYQGWHGWTLHLQRDEPIRAEHLTEWESSGKAEQYRQHLARQAASTEVGEPPC